MAISPHSAFPVLSGPVELIVHSGQTTRAHVLPTRGQVLVGRAPHCDVQIDDASISRQHFCLFVGAELEIEDFGSSNGTLVGTDGVEVVGGSEALATGPQFSRLSVGERRPIHVGHVIRAGNAIIVVERRQISSPHTTLRPLLGREESGSSTQYWPAILVNAELKRHYEIAAMAAATDISVLVLGETGVGKEVFAEFIHRRSPRATRPFLRLNCAALSEPLLESELFGHEKGSFTGAHQTKPGLLEATHGGTVFLDEVGELPQSIQVKLLRVLDERVVRRVGSNKPRPIDVRFITATNRDLKREVSSGRFRGDLYFRINGATFCLPPLRERRDEIEPLAIYFLTQACNRIGRRLPTFTAEARQQLLDYGWWGNARELRNAMERVSFLCGDGPVLPTHLPSDGHPEDAILGSEATDIIFTGGVAAEAPTLGGLGHGLSQVRPAQSRGAAARPEVTRGSHETEQPPPSEATRLLKALSRCGGNQTRTARMLGISRRTLINRLERHRLPRPRKGRGEPSDG